MKGRINMGNMVSYLEEYGGYTFVEKALCEVDALVFSQLTYYVFDGIVPGMNDSKPPIELGNLPALMDNNNFICVGWDIDNSRKVFEKIVNSRRFRSARICNYVNEIDKEKEIQFCAMVFLLGNGDIFTPEDAKNMMEKVNLVLMLIIIYSEKCIVWQIIEKLN